ncbi:MAG TPA: 3-oxoacyl-[acyl-carrier-protein] synthase III C-terminal domain-containing protein [Candidatus Bathyarchaeia archaeon]|nr:3-oxoacyl-[acyl-carrier-protein] synthase III C-terminal domain-containing protein [Candidatus Bathyarchaeia archaeon]
MRLASVVGAFPGRYYEQAVILETLKRQWGNRLERPERLERLHRRAGVEGRHLALPIESYERLVTWGQANAAWFRVAEELGAAALGQALEQAGIPPEDLDALFVVSITGIASPSLDARLINRMGLNRRVTRLPVFGLGCVGGAAGLSRAADYVRAHVRGAAALLAVELCSLTFRRDDVSAANQVSAGLFGDAAAALVVTGAALAGDGPCITATRSVFYPDTEDVMGWDISELGFRIVLSRGVPDIVKRHLADDVDAFLADQDLTRADIGSWIIHPGGPKVLEAVETALDLPEDALRLSWDCLRRVGNASSVSVLLVLEKVMQGHRPAPGSWSLLAALGPGFCSELVLLRW